MKISSGSKIGGGAMDYFCVIQSMVAYVENRLKSEVEYSGLEKATGFSIAHIRDVFRERTNLSLARYILYRRVSNAAFEIVHTDRSITEIALDYCFESYDTFTRAFKRITGYTPSDFRKKGFRVGRVKLTAGIYGPGIVKTDKMSIAPHISMEDMIKMKSIIKSEDSCVLYGVRKVEYSYEECTPFPSSLRSCLNYVGQEISYSYLMAATGAAFRLRWNTMYWDGGNVDIMNIYENPYEAFEKAFKAAGRSFKLLKRAPETAKQNFISFIKQEIDEGRPVIAFGIIGPPEACIVTGYRDNGEVLLGWNFFQDNPEFARNVKIDESGYFIASGWWENPDTKALISIGEEQGIETSIQEILQNAVYIQTKERIGDHAGGQAAYDAWATVMSDENQFPKSAILSILFERLMCQNDAITMLGEGRAYAACFMEWVAKRQDSVKEECLRAASLFRKEHELAMEMPKLLGGWGQGEEHARRLAEPSTRKELEKLIKEAKQLDAEACELLKMIVNKL